MSDELQVLQYHPTVEVRMVMQDGEPWWVLADVCRVLEIRNSRDAANRLDDDEKGVGQIDTPGGPRQMTVINESGLYSVILRSDKPEAKAFKRWITHEVLPSIRRTGTYSVNQGHQEKLLPLAPALPRSKSAQHLWLVLLEIDRMQGKDGKVQISSPDIMRLMGVGSMHTITAARKKLEAEGLLDFTQGTKANPSTYHLKGR